MTRAKIPTTCKLRAYSPLVKLTWKNSTRPQPYTITRNNIKKLLNLKIFPSDNESSGWKKSVLDVGGEILVVSQFTLHAVYKGTKPSFHRSMAPTDAELIFQEAVAQLKANYSQDRVAQCVFGSYMNVSLVNDGPVTLILDSRQPKGG